MRLGDVSDERYVALSNVSVLLERGGRGIHVWSRADGSIDADIEPGTWHVTLAKDGYGSKRVTAELTPDRPFHFRLLKDGLLGYMWPKWSCGGQASEFRVHSDAQYHVSLWRYGLDTEFIRPIGWFDEHGPRATVQVTPDGDYSPTGARFNSIGYTSPHHRQFLTAPERSGLYYLQTRTEDGRFFSFPWIVAPEKATARVAVLASNITWNAYNSFGGRSNYIHPDALPPTPTVNSRMELKRYTDPEHINYDTTEYTPLSFDRPEPVSVIPQGARASDPIPGRAGCHLAAAEWRLLAWLEREGFAYDYWAETQLHFGPLDLDHYQVLIISTHPEYWSRQMYDRVKDWVYRRGGRLMYLGGNGLNCDVEFLDEQTCIYRNDDVRRMREPGAAYESRFHLRGESEANLLGVAYDDRGIMTAAPYQVSQAGHWVFQGTGLSDGDQFGIRSLHERVPGGASGHETDKRTPSSPAGLQLLARGLNPNNGGAEMVAYETPSGGAVFSAGSICWTSSILVDEGVSRITANVLRRFLR